MPVLTTNVIGNVIYSKATIGAKDEALKAKDKLLKEKDVALKAKQDEIEALKMELYYNAGLIHNSCRCCYLELLKCIDFLFKSVSASFVKFLIIYSKIGVFQGDHELQT